VVVVDSFSTDGTVDYLRQNLAHPNIRFCDHPPGLYASWNHGISQISSPYFFMATTGDLITPEGINALMDAAVDLDCNVVISKPNFRDREDKPLSDTYWPIDDIISTLGIKSPRRLTKLESIVFTAMHPGAAMLGSSASNLYSTEVWKRLPFPTDFGSTGDGAWAFKHVAEITWGVLPERYSSFLVHPNSITPAEKKSFRDSKRPDVVLRESLDRWLRDGFVTPEESERLQWYELMDVLGAFLDAKSAFDTNRRSKIPWVLNPNALQNRIRRQQNQNRLENLKRQIIGSKSSAPSPAMIAHDTK
jgi:glycosyltransferase involved in cell wall biosynthesis